MLFYAVMTFLSAMGQADSIQELRLIDGRIGIQKIIIIPGKNSSQIYSDSKKWIAASFKNPDKIIVFQDSSLIKIRYISTYRMAGTYQNFNNIIYIDIKDEKIRFTFKEIEHSSGYPIEEYSKGDATFGWMYKKLGEDVLFESNKILLSLTNFVNKPKSEW